MEVVFNRPHPFNELEGATDTTNYGVTFPVPDQKPIKQGYLRQLTKNTKQWKKSWFVLRDVSLMSYKNEKEYQIRKIINLGKCQFVGEEGKHKANSNRTKGIFGIVSHNTIYYLRSDDESDMKIWITCIRHQMELAKKNVFYE